MNEAASSRRRRAVEAMGLGPLWLMRDTTAETRAGPFVEHSAGELATRTAQIGAMGLDAIEVAVTTCRACALGASRTQAVPGGGATRPHWMIVAAAPSAEDDATGIAMAGQAGRLLDAMLSAVGLSRRDSAFVTASVKCRPPDDRPATPEETARCKPFLDRQIELLAPRLILAIGADAGGDRRPSTDVPLIATLHPAELLERPAAKAAVWADLCRARSLA